MVALGMVAFEIVALGMTALGMVAWEIVDFGMVALYYKAYSPLHPLVDLASFFNTWLYINFKILCWKLIDQIKFCSLTWVYDLRNGGLRNDGRGNGGLGNGCLGNDGLGPLLCEWVDL